MRGLWIGIITGTNGWDFHGGRFSRKFIIKKGCSAKRPTALWHLELLVIANELSGRWGKWFLHWVNGWTKDFSILDLIPRFYVSRIKKDLDKFLCGRNHYRFLLEAEIQYNTNLWSNVKEKGREEERDKKTLMRIVLGPVLKFVLSHVILTITLWGGCDLCPSYRCSERLSDLPKVTVN